MRLTESENTKELLGEPKTVAVLNDCHILHGVTKSNEDAFDRSIGLCDCYSRLTIYGKCTETVGGRRRHTTGKVVVKFINEFGMLTSTAMENVIRNYDEYIKENSKNNAKLMNALDLYVKNMLMYDLSFKGIVSFCVYDFNFE